MLSAALSLFKQAKVTAIDINPVKHKLICRLGEIDVRHPADLQDEKFDVVIEAAGTKAAVEQAIQLVRPGGDLILIGLTPEATLPVMHVVRSEITIHGSIIYNFPNDFQDAVNILRNPAFYGDPIISEVIPVREYKEAYEKALSGNYGKIVLEF